MAIDTWGQMYKFPGICHTVGVKGDCDFQMSDLVKNPDATDI